jgi:hypothetical protein
MPTILYIRGWRLFFYFNERNEPPHVHARKGDIDCKFWLLPDTFSIEEVYGYNLNPANRRDIRKIIFENFEYIVSEYQAFHEGDAA